MEELKERILAETTDKMLAVIGNKIDSNGLVTLNGSQIAELCAGVISVALKIYIESSSKTIVYEISNN